MQIKVLTTILRSDALSTIRRVVSVMGNDVNLYLPPDVEPRHLAEFFSLKMGAEPMIESMEYGGFSVHPHVDLVEAKPSNISGMEYLNWKGGKNYDANVLSPPFQPRMHYSVAIPEHMYKRVPPEMKKRFGKVWNELAASSSPQRLALFRAAADFFGGIVVPQDVDWDKIEWHKRTMPVDGRGLMPEDNPAWARYQMALYWVAPLTQEDIRRAWADSGYKSEDVSVSFYPVKEKELPVTALLRRERLDTYKRQSGSGPQEMVVANRAVKRKLKGPGMGWWGQPVRHKMAAKKGAANRRRK